MVVANHLVRAARPDDNIHGITNCRFCEYKYIRAAGAGRSYPSKDRIGTFAALKQIAGARRACEAVAGDPKTRHPGIDFGTGKFEPLFQERSDNHDYKVMT